MSLGHFPKKRAASPILEKPAERGRYPQMKRNGLIDGDIKINRIEIRGFAVVEVVHVDSPSCIWVRLANNIREKLTITEPYELERVSLRDHNAEVQIREQYYMAPWKDRVFRRVRVIASERRDSTNIYAKVIYIDVGVTRWVDAKCLAVMPVHFHYHPWQAICLSLGDLQKMHFGRRYGEYHGYWEKEDCDMFRQLMNDYAKFEVRVLTGSVLRNDYREPIKVEMYGIDEAEEERIFKMYRKNYKGQSITCMYAARSRGRVRYIHVDNVSNFPLILNKNDMEKCIPEKIPSYLRRFPKNWVHKEEIDEPLIIPREEWDAWTIEKAMVPICDVEWLDTNGFKDAITNSYWVCVEGTHTISPYEWYGRPIKRIKKKFTVEERAFVEEKMKIAEVEGDPDDQGELGDITMSMLNSDTELKSLSEHLDAFYALPGNRFALENDQVKDWLRNDQRVFAITCCTEERARYTGEWQRVEVFKMTNHAEVRYLDSGGRELIAASNLFRLHPRHAAYPPLCIQFCLHGTCDPDPENQKKLDFCKVRKGAFRTALRVDVPLLIDVLVQPYRDCKRVPDVNYKEEHVLYAYNTKLMGEPKSFTKQLSELHPKHRLQENSSYPIEIDQLFPSS